MGFNFGPNITITISGPGGSVNYDAELIRTTLALLGYKFEVKNDWPLEEQLKSWRGDQTVESYMADTAQRITEMPTIQLIVNNLPWGG